MAKDKKVELQYKLEGIERMKKRKAKRIKKYIENIKESKKTTCNCGYYCYCGNGKDPYY